MKTITFFNEKGGVGKSSFSMMYASWLQQYGIKVGLADFNHRISNYRNTEIRERKNYIKKNPDKGIKPLVPEESWPIVECWSDEVAEYKKNGLMAPYAYWFRDKIKESPLTGLDVVLCDFPGSFDDGSFTDLLLMKCLGLVVIPTERDTMTLTVTLRLKDILQKQRKNFCAFVNKAQINFKNYRNAYISLGQNLVKSGVPMLPDMVTYSERMATIEKVDIIRSTFGFPDFSKPEYAKISDLGINNLFIDITKELAKSNEYPNTRQVDLSFVNELKKKQDNRSFTGSSFPEYEI